jgi:hypothetical protein
VFHVEHHTSQSPIQRDRQMSATIRAEFGSKSCSA